MKKHEEKTRNYSQYMLIGLVILVIGYLWYKNSTLENKINSLTAVSPTQTAPLNALDVANLKKYAADLSLDSEKFNKCLDESKYKERVNKDIQQAQSELSIRGTPAFLINGRFLGGAFPYESFAEIIDKELNGTGSDYPTNYSANLQEAAKSGAFTPQKKKVTILDDDPVLGPEDAKMTLVEFSDFQCPFCVRAYPTTKQILDKYQGKIKFVYKQMPLNNIHPYAQKAAEASLCAHEQGKFFEYHDRLFEESAKQL